MVSDAGQSSRRPYRFSDAVQAIQSSFRGQRHDGNQTGEQADSASISKPTTHLTLDVQQLSSLSLHALEVFPVLTEEHLRNTIMLEGEAVEQVMTAYEEAKLNWDLDTRLIGGQRSETNLGMARVFGLLSIVRSSENDLSNTRTDGGVPLTGQEAGPDGKIIPARQERAEYSEATSEPKRISSAKGTQEVFHTQYETHDLLRAIDRKDTQTIMMIRDSNFDLLLDLNQGGTGASMSSGTVSTPLGYCIGLGKGWEGVAVVLTGALSKFVNSLPDEEEEDSAGGSSLQHGALSKKQRKRARRELDPRTMSRLRKLRTSLKLAIDHSLSVDQTRLLSSYLQVLLMSSGQTFIRETVDTVHQALLTQASGSQVDAGGHILSRTDPFEVARQSITSFFTDSLKTKSQTKDVSQRIASVDDLMNNCIGDLVLMAIWQDVVLQRKELARLDNEEKRKAVEERVKDEDLTIELPTWSFARDDRITSIFIERLENLQKVLDIIDWETKGRTAASSTRGTRNSRIWKEAKHLVEVFQSQTKRQSSKDRLALLQNGIA